ncbi:unnamed protein product [Closterium sp. NIES-64]|nr:unnamed protein product [Closterium sp. NIES-64]CAI6005530.1 unnamed protein product [Closterium sp. NIES-65]
MASALALHLACAPLASLAIARTPSSTPPQFATARHATLVASRPASARDLPRRRYRVGIARAANDGAPAVTSVSVGEARELVAAGHTYLDVRTPEEFRAAHVEGAVNIPFMLKSPSGMVKNDAFVADVKAQFDEDTPLVVACQGGVRSIRAAAELQNAGFSGITDMLGGFAAWQQKGFPSVF